MGLCCAWVLGVGAEFLSDAQMAAFGRFRGVPSREQLERYFLLDDADQALVARRRGDQNRLGFSVQLPVRGRT